MERDSSKVVVCPSCGSLLQPTQPAAPNHKFMFRCARCGLTILDDFLPMPPPASPLFRDAGRRLVDQKPAKQPMMSGAKLEAVF
jgi:hypothetical protein